MVNSRGLLDFLAGVKGFCDAPLDVPEHADQTLTPTFDDGAAHWMTYMKKVPCGGTFENLRCFGAVPWLNVLSKKPPTAPPKQR